MAKRVRPRLENARRGKRRPRTAQEQAGRWIGARGRDSYRRACRLLVRVRDLCREADREDV